VPIFGLGRKKSDVATPPAAPAVAPPAPARRDLRPVRSLEDHGDPVLAALLGVAASRDWPALRAGLEPHGGHDLSALIGNVCAKLPDLDAWVPQEEGDALARAVLGAAAVERGWNARTKARAQYVSQDQFQEFHRLLRVAEEHLYAAVELDPALAAPWYTLMITSRGLQYDLDVKWRRFDALVARAPGHLGGHRQMLQNLCEKWSGTHEQMHEFAAAALRGEHRGQLAELVPDAHIEHWLQLGDKQGGREYMQQPKVRAELEEAAELTVFRPGYSCPRSPYWAANLFAMAFGLSGLWGPATRAFEATEGVVGGRWTYMSGREPEKFYSNWRNHVLQKASS
jgi:hypothetical protein